jgi:mRNA-degrading endonuclease YafQ of YafQ-DinJ toxin-antitoxin module
MRTKLVLLLLAAASAVSARPKSHELQGYSFEQVREIKIWRYIDIES